MNSFNTRFFVADDVLALGLNVACFIVEGINNKESTPEFESYLEQETNGLLRDLTSEKIKNDPILQGFRLLHQRADVSNRKNISAAENLLKMLLKHGQLPRINLLVDIYNLVSVKTRLSLGAHDLQKLGGDVHLKLTTGTERFWPIGTNELSPVKPGEYAYVDDDNDIICRLEVRQVEKTKVLPDTTACFFIVQGNPATSPACLQAACAELIELITRFCGGQERMLYKTW